MTPPAATASGRRGAAARQRTAIRRRALLTAGALLLAVIGLVLAAPLFRQAVNDLTLPLADQDIIRAQAADKNLDPALIAAVIYAETKFDPRTSSAGALGLVQIEPATAQFLARRSGGITFTTGDLSKPAVNIAYGSYYLRYLLDHYNGNEMLAVAAYNGGITNVDRWRAQAGGDAHAFTIRDIPFPETRAYVEKVLQAQKDYRRTYATELGYR
jgi:soluble lytic murein transglycosylase